MTTNEEKIKAFLNDEEFVEKVAGGAATPETYRKELKKIDLNLSPEEALEVKKVTEKILSTPENKLDDTLLEQVSGGVSPLSVAGGVTAGVSLVGTIGCGIARHVMQKKLHDAINKGNLDDIRKYESLANKLELSQYGGGIVGIIGGLMLVRGSMTVPGPSSSASKSNEKADDHG